VRKKPRKQISSFCRPRSNRTFYSILNSGLEKDGLLRVAVKDTGSGFKEASHSGMGLSSIRERLQSLYGDGGRLILEDNQPHGLKATIY
jgi:LytS/YehU family sensor histidine kinase